MEIMSDRFTIVGIGEALFDVFPDAEILGGAPLNVAVHAHQLGGRGVVVSRVGQDDLGQRVAQQLHDRDMDTTYLQTDPDHATGRVHVGVDAQGEPDYDIVENVAWDWLQFDPDLETLAQRCDAVCFGTLAQRTAQSRNTIYRFVEAARGIKLFDVNLRQDYYDQNMLRRSCELASAVKLNNDELPVVAKMLGLGEGDDESAAAAMMKKYRLSQVVLTRGEGGTTIHAPDQQVSADVPTYDRAENADNVGAGDACAAAILAGLALRKPLQDIVALANHAGAFVASHAGAVPSLPQSISQMLS